MFWTKKPIPQPENLPDDRFRRLEHRLTLLESEVLDVATSLSGIRTKIMSKLKLKTKEADDTDESYEAQSLYDKVLLKEK